MNRPPFRPPPRRSPHDRKSFSLYPKDRQILADLQAEFANRGLNADRTTLVRCLLHSTSELALFAYAVVQHREDSLKTGPREQENVAERFTIEQLGDDRDKLERVLRRLEAEHIRMNDSYALRALLRHLPSIERLLPLFKSYVGHSLAGAPNTAGRRAQHG